MNGVQSDSEMSRDHERVRDESFLSQSKQEERRMWLHLALILPNILYIILKSFYRFIFPIAKKDVRGQVALITGGANGIGREIAINFAKNGCNIAILDINLMMANKTAAELVLMGIKAKAYKCDVSKAEDIEMIKCEIIKDFGAVDILINNAGIFFCQSPEVESVENLQRMININLMSNFWTTRCFLNEMIEQKRGHIVSISSVAGLAGLPTCICYTASKFGVRGFMEGLALDLHHRGLSEKIKTTTVFPYFVDTNPGIKTQVIDQCIHKVMFDPKMIGKEIVEGVLRNEEIITFPRSIYFLCYLLNAPLDIKRIILKVMAKSNKTV